MFGHNCVTYMFTTCSSCENLDGDPGMIFQERGFVFKRGII